MNEDPIALIYEQRLIVLLENDSFDGFNQVLLNRKQFKKVSDAIFMESHKDPTLKDGYETGTLRLDDERTIPATLFEGMNSIEP